MSELVVVGFKDAEEADRVLLRLAKLKKEHLIDLEDAVVVIRDEAGRVHIKQSINPTIEGATTGFMLASGSLWGGADRTAAHASDCRLCIGRRNRRRGRGAVRLSRRLRHQR